MSLSQAITSQMTAEERAEAETQSRERIAAMAPDQIADAFEAAGNVILFPDHAVVAVKETPQGEVEILEPSEVLCPWSPPASAGEVPEGQLTAEAAYSETADAGGDDAISDGDDDYYGDWNDAALIGPEPEGFADFLQKPATFLIGELWGAKDRRNTQDGDWKEVTMPWGQWIEGGGTGSRKDPFWGFSRHQESKHKEGGSIVLGSSIDGARKAHAMDEMSALGLDIDSGAQIDDVKDKIRALGLFALIYTSHSHGKSGLELKRDEVIRKLGLTTEPTLADVQTFLRAHGKSRYEESFITQVRIADPKKQTKDGVKIALETPPLDKFRIILPLAEAVKLIDLAPTQAASLEVWEDKVTGAAWEMLGVHWDVSCSDPSRLFFTARHAPDAEWDCMIIRGAPLRFEDVPVMKKSDYTKGRDKVAGAGREVDRWGSPLCSTPSGKSLNDWHFGRNGAKDRFQIATLLETECSDKIRHAGGEAQGHVHLECPFEHQHSKEGGTGTMAIDALDAKEGYWTVFCHHDSCQGRHKLQFLEEMLAQGWFEEEVLYDEDAMYLMPAGEEVSGTPGRQDGPANAGTDEFEPVESWLDSRYRRLGDRMYRRPSKAEVQAWEQACKEAKENGEDEPKQPEPVEICGAFDVVGRSSNADGTEGAGRIISFEGENGKRVEVTLSLAEIRSDPKAVFDILSDRGLWLPVGKNAKINLQMLLNSITPQRQIPTIESPGWTRNEHGEIDGYMLPTGEYLTKDGAGQMRLSEGARFEVVKPRGEVDKFTAAAVESFKYTETNFYWPLGLAAGFAGPLLGILKERSCGIVLSGHSSLGKSLGQELGASVFGSPEEGDGGFHSAKTTTNAIEDLCVITTHTTFMFDEIGAFQDKKHLESVLFGMAVGVSKARKKDRNIGLAQRVRFNPFVVMSSEFGIKQEIESGGGNYRDGLVARFPDIDVGSDGLHVSKDKRSILEAVRYNYGHAGPVMVRYMIDSGIAFDRQKLADEVDVIIAELSKGKPPVIERAAKPFALILRGGEIAADAGVLGDPDKAKTAIRKAVFKAWDVFTSSDEASAASGGDALLDTILSKLNGMWGRTIIKAGEVFTNEATGKDTVVGEADGNIARGTPVGWYDDDHIYLDWEQIAKPAEVFGVPIKRAELVNVLGKTVVRKTDREAPQTRLPVHVAQAAGGDGRAVRNLKLKRAELGM
ncbi:DUF927 domain-containing protein [Ruegeria sediminis]|uniref:DUF927 domain-containing protein n=1 Tax=Ruegeria sediminis TaxID=2583820 RepID=A0ABY2WUR2_9RHOB|nr:DUF927 domain-containing protein [Ruegeria sediminis]TMV06318.1 DUF927 domain-containing protein [Ruegeria sediminis]